VVRDLVGHGIGKDLHEDPQVPNYGKRGKGPMLQEGWVIAIEPMINMGTFQVRTLSDKWTIITKDNKPSAHFEHTVAVKRGKADILSDHNLIFEAIKKVRNILRISDNYYDICIPKMTGPKYG
jgi:methionyl aminopeptidase